ncbi:MAG TPA: N-acetyl-gamma-glutamyl-phosphate reductase [Candidatus Dormibacteraeota bacterium]|nr:N-acetyl-gamma-glutamyl-phosphate reductase [Candidatus Dormibacteraeota bacterium]
MPETGEALRVAVAGATGYAGAGCVRLLLQHPGVELVSVSSRTQAGKVHSAAYPGSTCDHVLVESINAEDCDLVISASAPGEAARQSAAWLAQGAVVMDVSADFRLKSPTNFANWYGLPHPTPELLPQAILALPELRPQAITGAHLIALPGCFSTATILACGPAVERQLIEAEVVVDGKTGVSGAGRSASAEYLFTELNESVKPYSISGHRHRPEMEQVLSELGGAPVVVTFVPHLVPMTRGIQVTCYLRPRVGVTLEQFRSVYQERYRDQPFVRVSDSPVGSKQTTNTNLCWLSLAQQGSHFVVSAVLDNLGRGASAQAVQVMNLRFGLSPRAGLGDAAQWP